VRINEEGTEVASYSKEFARIVSQDPISSDVEKNLDESQDWDYYDHLGRLIEKPKNL